MRKQYRIKYLVTIFCFIIMFGLNIFAEGKTQQSESESIISDYFSHRVENNIIKINLSNQNLGRLKSDLKTRNQTENEIYTTIYKELGYSDAEIASIGHEEISSTMNKSSEITVNIQYVKVNKNGDMIIMEKNQCLKEVAVAQQLEMQVMEEQKESNSVDITTDNNDQYSQINAYDNIAKNAKNQHMAADHASNENHENTDISEDGYMKLITRCDYLPCYRGDEKGWYMFSAIFTWLKQPYYKMTDAMSLFANNVAWYPDSFYSSYYFEAQFLDTNQSEWIKFDDTETKTNATVQPTGIYFTWPLTRYGNDSRYMFLSRTFYIRGIARVSQFNQEYAGNLYAQYQHVRSTFNIQPSFGWTLGERPGVTVTGAWLDDYTTYSGFCYFAYDPNQHYYH